MLDSWNLLAGAHRLLLTTLAQLNCRIFPTPLLHFQLSAFSGPSSTGEKQSRESPSFWSFWQVSEVFKEKITEKAQVKQPYIERTLSPLSSEGLPNLCEQSWPCQDNSLVLETEQRLLMVQIDRWMDGGLEELCSRTWRSVLCFVHFLGESHLRSASIKVFQVAALTLVLQT